MLTISKPLSAGKAQEYHRAEFANAKENYYSEGEQIRGEWQGQLAAQWGLTGGVVEEQFTRLSEGQHPNTGEQIVTHQTSRTYVNTQGETIRTMEHRAGWDATFSAPKSVSLTALTGGDERIRIAHRESVNIALNEMEKYAQARIGGSNPAVTTGKWAVAKFEHDSSRPVDGYAAPQLHTHAVIFNMVITEDGVGHALQPYEIFRTQRLATAVYRAELALRLQEIGYQVVRGEHGSPEIAGYTKEYLEASSPRRKQIENHLKEHGVSGAAAAQIAAYQTRETKLELTREQVLSQHLEMAEKFGNQPQAVVSLAQGHVLSTGDAPLSEAMLNNAMSTAVARNIERDAVIDERVILADALKHGLGVMRTEDAHAGFTKLIERGAIVEMDSPAGQASHRYTTPEMKGLEAENIYNWSKGVAQHDAIAENRVLDEALEVNFHLSESQQVAVRTILENRDQVMGLEGAAGTGKTTALKAVCEAAKQSGYEVTGLAPTSRAALNLESAQIETKTLARHLTEAHTQDGVRHLYIVDESSMASTRQANDFLKSIHDHDRVLLVGDTRQHEAVDAGRPYAQLREAGMQTAQLNEIIRQKDPALKKVVEQLSRGEVEKAIQNLSNQGRVHEYSDRADRIQAIANEYVKQPDGTLVISPDNASRMEIASTIHSEMQALGKVSKDEHTMTVLVTRQDMTAEDRRWAQSYEQGDVLRFTRGNKTIDVEARERVSVSSSNEKENLITVERSNGEQITYDPRRINGVTVYREAERNFAEGDRIQFTTPYHPEHIANRELGILIAIDADGNLKLAMDSGRNVDFNLRQHPHLDYGYAVTSHSSQGETADRVLIHVDSEHAHKGLINERMAYVAVSRARDDAQIFTNDAESLGHELSRDVSHSTALKPDELSMSVGIPHESIQEFSPGLEM